MSPQDLLELDQLRERELLPAAGSPQARSAASDRRAGDPWPRPSRPRGAGAGGALRGRRPRLGAARDPPPRAGPPRRAAARGHAGARPHPGLDRAVRDADVRRSRRRRDQDRVAPPAGRLAPCRQPAPRPRPRAWRTTEPQLVLQQRQSQQTQPHPRSAQAAGQGAVPAPGGGRGHRGGELQRPGDGRPRAGLSRARGSEAGRGDDVGLGLRQEPGPGASSRPTARRSRRWPAGTGCIATATARRF